MNIEEQIEKDMAKQWKEVEDKYQTIYLLLNSYSTDIEQTLQDLTEKQANLEKKIAEELNTAPEKVRDSGVFRLLYSQYQLLENIRINLDKTKERIGDLKDSINKTLSEYDDEL